MSKIVNKIEEIEELEEEVENVEDVSQIDLKKLGLEGYSNQIITAPLKAIKAHCIECCGDSYNEMKACNAKSCYLWPFRFGKNPYRTPRVMSEEKKAYIVQRLQQGRLNKKN